MKLKGEIKGFDKHTLNISFFERLQEPPSSPIQTILSALESHQILP